MASKAPDAEDDAELSDLLDSALDDFNKHLTAVSTAVPQHIAANMPVTATSGASSEAESPLLARDTDDHVQAEGHSASACAEPAGTVASASAAAAAAATDAPSSQGKTKKKKKKSSSSSGSSSAANADTSKEAEEWMQAFSNELKQAEKEFGDAMHQFSGGNPDVTAQLAEMMQGLGPVPEDGSYPGIFGQPPPFGGFAAPPSEASGASAAAAGGSVEDQLAQTLSGMQENLKSSADLSGSPGEEEFMKMLQQQMSGTGSSGSSATSPDPMGGGGLLPMMENMMHTLLSSEVLYPSVKELSVKLQSWLVEHEDDEAVSADERTRFSRQLDILRSVCAEYESGQESESASVKQKQYEKVLQLMQQMQEYGHPPQEVMQELAPDMKMDASGTPSFPGLPPLPGMGMPFAPGGDRAESGREQCIMM